VVSEVLPEVNSSHQRREMGKFLDEAHKKCINDEIRERRREKKLQHETAHLCLENQKD
jgi:hypothetical protein